MKAKLLSRRASTLSDLMRLMEEEELNEALVSQLIDQLNIILTVLHNMDAIGYCKAGQFLITAKDKMCSDSTKRICGPHCAAYMNMEEIK